MAGRHLSRSVVLQSLFEWDYNNYDDKELKIILDRNKIEFASGVSDYKYVDGLSGGILLKKDILNEVIIKAAPEWPLERISLIDRNVLRIGLYELLFGDRDEVPPKVAINEAIELAKAFGGENSGKFVNGVLGTVYREIGEPGKGDSSAKTLDISKMPKEYLGGAVVFKIGEDGRPSLAFVHDVFGYWTLSKGHILPNENIEAGTIREIKEELGIDVKILGQIGENEYTASDPENGKIRKHVYYFLAKTKDDKITLTKEGGLDDAKWFTLNEVASLKMYGDMVSIVTDGIKKIIDETRE